MAPLLLAVAIIIAGVAVAILGVRLTARADRRAVTEPHQEVRSDLAFGVTIVGTVAVMVGFGYAAFVASSLV